MVERAGTERRVLLRIPEVAERLALGRSTVYRLIAEGQLPTVKIGAAVRIPAVALEEWVASQLGGVVDGSGPRAA
jgi:excisionase family DNA binding protein